MLFIQNRYLVPPVGFEPTLYTLEECCSIQLSYGGGTKLESLVLSSESYSPRWSSSRESNSAQLPCKGCLVTQTEDVKLIFGATKEVRTPDLPITKRMLYQLSYGGVCIISNTIVSVLFVRYKI